MALCGNCGKQAGEGNRFCPSCGKPMDQAEQGDALGASCPPAGEDNTKTMSILAIVIAIVSAILTGVVVAVGGYGAIMAITAIVGILWAVYGLGVTALYVLGIVHAVKGELKPLPIIGGISLIK